MRFQNSRKKLIYSGTNRNRDCFGKLEQGVTGKGPEGIFRRDGIGVHRRLVKTQQRHTCAFRSVRFIICKIHPQRGKLYTNIEFCLMTCSRLKKLKGVYRCLQFTLKYIKSKNSWVAGWVDVW